MTRTSPIITIGGKLLNGIKTIRKINQIQYVANTDFG